MKKIICLLIVALLAVSADAQASYESGSCTSGSFRVSFSGANFVTGLGWSTGGSRTITFSGSCSGCSLGPIVYGWGSTPLVEYYIGRSGGSSAGTYSTSKGTYTLYTNSCNGPNITGTGPFTQYNAGGSASSSQPMGEHFSGWSSLGKGITSQNYMVVMVEGWSSNSGSANVSVSSSEWYTHWVGSGTASFTCGGGTTTTTASSTSTTTTTASSTSTTTTASSTSTTTTASSTSTTSGTTTSTTSGTGCTCAVGCSSATNITAPFDKNGVADQCFVATSIPNYINSWNMAVLNINGTDLTNRYVSSGGLPAKINGNYYIYYKGNYAWSHFEAR